MKRIMLVTLLACVLYLSSCNWRDDQPHPEESTLFTQIGAILLVGGETAAEFRAGLYPER